VETGVHEARSSGPLPEEIIPQRPGTGNSRRKQLARIVHGTGRDPQLAPRQQEFAFRAVHKRMHDETRDSRRLVQNSSRHRGDAKR
jgi:hypothetical protein